MQFTNVRLGTSDLEVTPICLGTMTFGEQVDEATSHAIMDRAIERGINFLDTAEMYSVPPRPETCGATETIIGNWFAARGSAMRARIVLATKVGLEMGPGDNGLSRDYIHRAVDRSLQRLRTDYIDLYQAHRDDPDTPLEETARAFDDLVRAGKVRVLGASNFTASRLEAALATSAGNGLARYECLQPHYNLVQRKEFETALAPLCAREALGVIPYFALASGFLTGKYRTTADLGKSPRGARMGAMLDARGSRILAALGSSLPCARHDACVCGDRLAHRARRHGPDRQRDERHAIARNIVGRDARTHDRRSRRAESGLRELRLDRLSQKRASCPARTLARRGPSLRAARSSASARRFDIASASPAQRAANRRHRDRSAPAARRRRRPTAAKSDVASARIFL